jgi:hypothetical protein
MSTSNMQAKRRHAEMKRVETRKAGETNWSAVLRMKYFECNARFKADTIETCVWPAQK